MKIAEVRRVFRLPGLRIRHVTVSPNGRWLAVSPDGHRSFLVGLDNGRAAESAVRKPLADDVSIESAHWSQDGAWLYYFSTQDDFRCLMAQRIRQAITSRPARGARGSASGQP